MKCAKWPPPKRSIIIDIAIAASVLSIEETLQLKTIKTGIIARAAAIYRVNKIIIYKDKWASKRDYRLLRLLLEYASTPPHLRKKVFPLLPELKAVGLLPPLRLPTHDLPSRPTKDLVVEGIVEDCGAQGCRVFLGRYGYGKLKETIKPGSRLFVKIIDDKNLIVERVKKPEFYTGFKVEASPDLSKILKIYKNKNYIVVGTSRKGECFSHALLSGYRDKKGIILVFGGPQGDVREEAPASLYDLIINTIPFQGSKTVRTEEAIHATLSLVNIHF